MRYALVNGGGLVLNVIQLSEPHTDWPLPTGLSLIQTDNAGPGWTWNGTVFVAPFSPTPPPLTGSELIDAMFPQTGTARVIFEAFFEIANRLQTLESKPSITRAQLKSWLISKFP